MVEEPDYFLLFFPVACKGELEVQPLVVSLMQLEVLAALQLVT
jgi:hypothetical protein